MNVKINKQQHEYLCKHYSDYNEYLFGSHLHGIATEESDKDVIRVISNDFYDEFNISKATFLPNIHSFQYDDSENNMQVAWMTERQFWYNLWSGDGNMIADVVILSGHWDEPTIKLYTFTYKVIKGYLGVAKRDLKLHPKSDKKRFHAWRSLKFASILLNGGIPTVSDIIKLKDEEVPSNSYMSLAESEIRAKLNVMLDRGDIRHYPEFAGFENNSLVKLMIESNNIREFRYE